MPFLSKKKLSLRFCSNESFLFINSAIKFMYEQMVLGVANVGSKKNRIVVILIISLMVSMAALLLPVQTYAAGEALSVLVGALAGYIAESTIGASLVAAGVGALIPEFAAALIAVAIGLGVSISVYMLFQCVQAWWSGSGSVSAVEMIANSWDKTKQRIVATPYVFATMVELIKSKILGIKTAADVGSSLPTFENMKHVVSNTWTTAGNTTYSYTLSGCEITDVHALDWANDTFSIRHSVDIVSGNISVHIQAPVNREKTFSATTWGEELRGDTTVQVYTPLLTSTACKLATVVDQKYENNINSISEVADATVQYITVTHSKTEKLGLGYDASTKKVVVSDYPSRWYSLEIGGEQIHTFDSINDFAYKFLYKASILRICTPASWQPVVLTVPLTSSASVPVSAPDISKNYSKSRDVISTTADSIGAKVASGDVTKDTAGSIAIPLIPSAAGELKTTTADVADVKITDVAIPGQIEADDTAKQEADIDPPGNIGSAFRQGGDMILDGAMTIGEKFPFDVIKCAYEWLQCLVQPGKPIVIDFTFDLPIAGKVPVKFDFSERQDVVNIINWLCIASTGIGLVLASRHWLLSI